MKSSKEQWQDIEAELSDILRGSFKNKEYKRSMLLDLLDVAILKIRNNDEKADIIELLKQIERLI